MCDPVSIALTVASQAAKSYMENKAANKVNQARTAAVEANIADQERYRKTAQAAMETGQQAASRPDLERATEAATAERTAAYQAPINQGELLPGQGDTSNAVRQAIVGALGTGVQTASEAARRKAILDAYGQATFGRDVTVGRAGQEIAQQADFGRGRVGILPIQLAAADRAGDKYKRIGSMVGAAGDIAGAAYGAKGFNPLTENIPAGKFSGGYGNYGNLGRVDWYPQINWNA